MSETGRRQRKFFKRKEEAEDARREELRRHKLYGVEGRLLKVATAQDATRALKVLKPYDVSLYQAAKFYEKAQEREAASRPFSDVWELFIESRANKSDSHNRTLQMIGGKLQPLLGKKLVAKIDHDTLRNAIRKSFPTASGFNLCLRSISPCFKLAYIEGWANENPCKRIAKIDTGRREIQILDIDQCRALFRVCRDYRKDESLKEYRRVDCRGAKAALALMLFAGIRPHETTRLDWADIEMGEGTVLVRNTKAKTDRSRFFDMPPVLKAWLETVPVKDRSGPIVPSSWKRVYALVREKAGISDERDILRKTFATAHLAHFKDVKETRSMLGHEAGDVLFQHYRGLMRPKEAAQLWKLFPGTENGKMEVVA